MSATTPASDELELFRRFSAAHALPWVRLAELPTPLERLPRTGAALGADLWVKRDDLSGRLYGGNKVRKLEFLLGDALAKGHDEVGTVGAIGSHHALATSLYARQLGLRPSVLHLPQPITAHVQRNLRALSTARPALTLVDAETSFTPEDFRANLRAWLEANPDLYYIPSGGSSPVGVLGYVNAALELVAQYDSLGEPLPDVVVVAAGTCGTLAGLLLGFALAGAEVEVVGVRVTPSFLANPAGTARLANACAERLEEVGLRDVPRLQEGDVTIVDDQFGEDYGVATDEGRAAMALVGGHDDLTLEPTYTAKAFAGLVARAEDFRARGARVLYWHTLSSADLGELVAGATPEVDLPKAYRAFLDDAPDATSEPLS